MGPRTSTLSRPVPPPARAEPSPAAELLAAPPPGAREKAFRDWIMGDGFPCVGAKSALVRDALEVFEAGRIDCPASDLDIRAALKDFSESLHTSGPVVQSFAVVFEGPSTLSEGEFEWELWNRLQSLHNLDVAAGESWAEGVDRDPESAHFAFSVAGEPFFVVGLNPAASRPARRFDYPVMVFNSHEQFERLKGDGRYDQMQKIIRQRELALCGSINPMLRDHGMGMAAAQYSGRHVSLAWDCPFETKGNVAGKIADKAAAKSKAEAKVGEEA